MAYYRKSIEKVLQSEGGYVNDKDDAGGETYRGIARRFWPKWLGWKFVDHAKTQPNFPGSLSGISGLKDMVVAFYKKEFWDKVCGDQIDDQSIADMLVDSAVNEGVKPAVKRAQAIVQMAQTGEFSEELITKLNALV